MGGIEERVMARVNRRRGCEGVVWPDCVGILANLTQRECDKLIQC